MPRHEWLAFYALTVGNTSHPGLAVCGNITGMAQRKDPPDPAITAWLAQAMEAAQHSQSSLARASGIGQTTIGRLLRGEVAPGYATLRRLGDALGRQPPVGLAWGGSVGEPPAPYRAGSPGLVRIPRLDVRASMGMGALQPDEEAIVGEITVSPAWLRQHGPFSAPSNLAIINAIGTSMRPTFNDGDLLLVDRGVTDIRLDAVYVLSRDGELFVKRVQRQFTGGLLILSDNPAHQPQAIPENQRDTVAVLGRVVLALNANKL